MKTLVEKINEGIINEGKIKPVNTTLKRFIEWWFGVKDFKDIKDKEFEREEFALMTAKEYFNNHWDVFVKFIGWQINEKITVLQDDVYDDQEEVICKFTVANVPFEVIATGIFGD